MPSRTVWSDSRGQKGRTVAVEERTVGGNVRLRWPKGGEYTPGEGSGYRTKSLGFSIRDENGRKVQAKIDRAIDERNRKYKELGLETNGDQPPPKTIRELFDRHDRQYAKHLSEATRKRYRARGEAWGSVLGTSTDPTDVTESDITRFLDRRESGAIDARGRTVPPGEREPVGPRTVEKDLIFLQGVYRWAIRKGWVTKNPVLRLDDDHQKKAENPRWPREKNPHQPVASEALYQAIRPVATEHQMEIRWNESRERQRSYLLDLIDIANGTGRRIAAICGLQHGDVDLTSRQEAPYGSLLWRAENDKMGNEGEVPMDISTREAVERAIENCPGPKSDSDFLFPRPGSTEEPLTKDLACKWYRRTERKLRDRLEQRAQAERKARDIEWRGPHRRPENLDEVPRVGKAPNLRWPERRGFHAYRRKWVNDRKHLPDVDLAKAGGWSQPDTVRRVYQQADSQGVLAVVLAGTGDSRTTI